MIRQVDWDHPDAVRLREARRLEIAEAYGRDGSEPAGSEASVADIAVFLVAYEADRPVGCGALREIDAGIAEIKRMYVVPDCRGTGVAAAILGALETRALELGLPLVRLETGDLLVAAQRFYEREGYRPIPPFGPYLGSELSRCYEKQRGGRRSGIV